MNKIFYNGKWLGFIAPEKPDSKDFNSYRLFDLKLKEYEQAYPEAKRGALPILNPELITGIGTVSVSTTGKTIHPVEGEDYTWPGEMKLQKSYWNMKEELIQGGYVLYLPNSAKNTEGSEPKELDATKLLLDRIISWEKDLSEYESLESILREQFVIMERVEVEPLLPYDENDIDSVKKYLRDNGEDPEKLAYTGITFVKSVMKNITNEGELQSLREQLAKHQRHEAYLHDKYQSIISNQSTKIVELEEQLKQNVERLDKARKLLNK